MRQPAETGFDLSVAYLHLGASALGSPEKVVQRGGLHHPRPSANNPGAKSDKEPAPCDTPSADRAFSATGGATQDRPISEYPGDARPSH